MSKKSRVTQELANGFPSWTKVRSDEQSNGQSLINVIGHNMETLDTELNRGFSNTHLTTANVDEIDLTYRFSLPTSFEFEVDNPNQLSPQPLVPTVSGRIGNDWYDISEVDTGSIKDFWYEAVPDRLSRVQVYSGVNKNILIAESSGVLWENLPDPFLDNRVYIDVVGPALLAQLENEAGFLQSKIRIRGTTWKDTEEAEEIGFIYSRSVKSNKVWKEIDRVDALDFPQNADITITSHGFNLDNYVDHYGEISQFEHSRDNLTSFWSINESCWASGLYLLENKTYAASRALDVLGNRVDLTPHREWELLDSGMNTIEPIDLAIVPFQQRAWVVTNSGLYLYELDWDTPSMHPLAGRTTSPLSQIVTNRDWVTRDEEVEVELRFVRPIKTVVKHRLSVKYPDGTSFAVLEDGSLVPTVSGWVINGPEERTLRRNMFFEFSDLGDHLLTLEAEYTGGIQEIDKRQVRVCSKTPLAQFDLSEFISTTVSGVDIDHQHRLLVVDDNNDVHYLQPHYDNMLIDYNGKEIIFREPYEEVKVIK